MQLVPRELEPLLSGEHHPQRGFSYPAERWRGWAGHLEGNGRVLGALPRELDRRTAARLVEGLLPGDVVGAFTVAMIWGHGTSGYGPYRTARVLTADSSPRNARVSPGVRSRLGESVEVAQEGGPVEGYRFLNNHPGKVGGLGPAFFTKWLYFVTARGDAGSATAAPVLDALVIAWLASHGGPSLRAGYTDDYARYVETLRSWGAPHGLAPANVEERIFRLIRNDGE